MIKSTHTHTYMYINNIIIHPLHTQQNLFLICQLFDFRAHACLYVCGGVGASVRLAKVGVPQHLLAHGCWTAALPAEGAVGQPTCGVRAERQAGVGAVETGVEDV